MTFTEKPNWETQLCSSIEPQLYFDAGPEGYGERCAFGDVGVEAHPRTFEGEIIPIESRHRCVVRGVCSICYEDQDSCLCQDEDCMGCTFCETLMTLEEFQIHKRDMVQSEANYKYELDNQIDDFHS